jgi:hypothetical protein
MNKKRTRAEKRRYGVPLLGGASSSSGHLALRLPVPRVKTP